MLYILYIVLDVFIIPSELIDDFLKSLLMISPLIKNHYLDAHPT